LLSRPLPTRTRTGNGEDLNMTRFKLGTWTLALAAFLGTAIPAPAHFRGGVGFRGPTFHSGWLHRPWSPHMGNHQAWDHRAWDHRAWDHRTWDHRDWDHRGRDHHDWDHHGWYHGSWDHRHWSSQSGYSPYANLYAAGVGGGGGGGGSVGGGGGSGYAGASYASDDDEFDRPQGLYSYGAGYGYDSVYPDLHAPSTHPSATPPGGGESLPPPLTADGLARLHICLPADAQLWVNGTTTSQTGVERHFTTAALPPGLSYRYIVRARWMRDGKPIELVREVEVRANQTTTVRLNAPRG
jgi:uncharacterized protein (TIGR03000 family)